MKKQFAVPPVVFPSGAGNLQHRPPFRPIQHPTPPIPFMSFDIRPIADPGTATTASASAAFSEEPSLLEELEIDPGLIYQKTISLLNPLRFKVATHDSADLSGPFLYYILFCLFQVLAGKVQFGIVLGWTVVFSVSLYAVFNMVEGKDGNLDLYRCMSVVGYSFLPVVVFSAVSLLLPQGGLVNYLLAVLFVLWSTRVCTQQLLHKRASHVYDHGGLIAYPCFLIYTLFSMLVVF